MILGPTVHDIWMKQPMLPLLSACKVESTLEQNEPQNHHEKRTEKWDFFLIGSPCKPLRNEQGV